MDKRPDIGHRTNDEYTYYYLQTTSMQLDIAGSNDIITDTSTTSFCVTVSNSSTSGPSAGHWSQTAAFQEHPPEPVQPW